MARVKKSLDSGWLPVLSNAQFSLAPICGMKKLSLLKGRRRCGNADGQSTGIICEVTVLG